MHLGLLPEGIALLNAASSATVRFDRVSAAYRGQHRPALTEASFAITAPVTFLIGENGAGKSTVFRLILGELRPRSGTIDRSWRARDKPGYVPQEFALPPQVTTRKYLAYLAWLKYVPRNRLPHEIARTAELAGLTEALDERLGTLSGGWRRRVGLAQALLGAPPLVCLDEPTAGLDPASRVMVRESLTVIAGEAQVLVSTHLTEDIGMVVSDPNLLVLDHGRVVFDGLRSQLPVVSGSPSSAHATPDELSLIQLMRTGRP